MVARASRKTQAELIEMVKAAGWQEDAKDLASVALVPRRLLATPSSSNPIA